MIRTAQLVLGMALGVCVGGASILEAQPVVQLVSRAVSGTPSSASGGTLGPAWRHQRMTSTDGRYSLVLSAAPNLIAGQTDANAADDIFLYDAVADTLTLVSHVPSSPTTTGRGICFTAAIAGDGSYVVFESTADNLVPGQQDVSNSTDIFLFQRATGAVTLISRAAGTVATTGNSGSTFPVINGDGRYVAFTSYAGDLAAGIVVNWQTVYLFDRVAGTLTLVSHASGSATTGANSESLLPVLSADGAYVAFLSDGTDLVAGQVDANDGAPGARADVFLWSRVSGEVRLVSRSASSPTTTGNAFAWAQTISDDGSFVAFESTGTNFVTGQADPNGARDVFLFDRATGLVTLVSHAAGALSTTGGGESYLPMIAGGGTRVVFTSAAANLVTGGVDNVNSPDTFLWNRQTGVNSLVSHVSGQPGTAAGATSWYPALSADGRFVTFLSNSNALLDGQRGPQTQNAFLYDALSSTSTLVSHTPASLRTGGDSGQCNSAPISADGARVVFTCPAGDLVSDDANHIEDVFVHTRTTGANVLVTRRAGPASSTANGNSEVQATEPAPGQVSDDGRFITFLSFATDVVPGQLDVPQDVFYNVFLYDAAKGGVSLVSHEDGNPTRGGSDPSECPVVSGTGNRVAFVSQATNLITGLSGGARNVFVYDRVLGEASLVSHRPGTPLNPSVGAHRCPTISADGRYVAFPSSGTDLVTGQTDPSSAGAQIFLYDTVSGVTTLVSHAAGAATQNSNSNSRDDVPPLISADGRYVAFASRATNLVAGQVDANGTWDVFVFDRLSGEVTLASHSPSGPAIAANAASGLNAAQLYSPRDLSLSADGAVLGFLSYATNLVAGQVDTNADRDVFVFHRPTGTVSLASHAPGAPATAGNSYSYNPVVSGNGTVVGFDSASDLIPGQTGSGGVFVFRRSDGLVTLASRSGGNASGVASVSQISGISADGDLVAFVSSSSTIAPGQVDRNDANPTSYWPADVFLFDRAAGTSTLVSHLPPPASGLSTGNAASFSVALSADGSTVAFHTEADDLVAGDANQLRDVFAYTACRTAPVISTQPQSQTVAIGGQATFTVLATNAGRYQWRKDGIDIPGATDLSYTTPPVTAAEAGAVYRAVAIGSCEQATVSNAAVLTIADSSPPSVEVESPDGGEYWLLSPPSGPPGTQIVVWSMSEDIRICRVEVSLLASNDGGVSYVATPAGGGLPASFGSSGTCPHPGEATTSVTYTVPSAFPSGVSGSLYKIEVRVTDQAGNLTVARSQAPFYIVQSNPDSVRTIILANVSRMQARMGISGAQASALTEKLQELSGHPRVQGLVVDLGGITDLTALFTSWDLDPGSPDKANAVLFGCHQVLGVFPPGCTVERNGVHDTLRTLLGAYTGAKSLVIVGDDRILPLARMADRTVLLPESTYVAGTDLTSDGTTVGRALAANKYLSDDPLAVADLVRPQDLATSVFIPDLSVGRLVETPAEMTTTIATFISQDGVLDLAALDPATGHKVLVSGYDFLIDAAKTVRRRWKRALGACTGTPPNETCTADASLAPVDGALIGPTWGLPTPAARASALRSHLAGNGGARYGVVNLDGHANHHAEGVPGTDPFDIAGLSAHDIYGPDGCVPSTPTQGALTLAGSVVYALGCHGGLPVAGSCATDADKSLDLPQTFLARGAVAYVANTGYGWGLKNGIGYGERLSELLTEELTRAGTVAFGDAVRRSKQRYYLEAPRLDSYDEKSLMQWTLFGLPMYAVKSGIAGPALRGPAEPSLAPPAGEKPAREAFGGVQVAAAAEPTEALPSYLTQLNLQFDFSAPGVYVKRNSEGDDSSVVPALANPGCPDANGCYYTLNGLVERSTGAGDLPLQPYFIYDSRLSGTSQHGVLWKGGTYREESGWKPVIGELVSNGGNGSNHGSTPREILIRPTPLRVVPGKDPTQCRPSDLELNTLVVPTGEALKPQESDPVYTIQRTYLGVELEAFYFNNTATAEGNCDRGGPALGAGPYHAVTGNTVSWSVPASDTSGVWRVLVVTTDGLVNVQGLGNWVPLELVHDGNGNWVGSRSFVGTSRVTYVVQAVDNRGNVTFLEYVAAQLPSSGVPPATAKIFDVGVSSVVNTPPSIAAAAALTRKQGSVGSPSPIATVSDAETAVGSLVVTAPSVPVGISVLGITNTAGAVSALVGTGCTAALGTNTVGLEVTDGSAATAADLTVSVTANTAPTMGSYTSTSVAAGASASISPSAAPADNGLVTLSVASGTFTGNLSVDSSTGVVSMGSANLGEHTVTVTATDTCGLFVERTFTLTVTGCGEVRSLVPDGRPTTALLAPGSTSFYEFLTTSGRSYAAQVASTVGTTWPVTVDLLAQGVACGAPASPGARDVSGLEPVLSTGTRVSFTAGAPLYQLRIANPGGTAVPVLLSVSETTLFNPAWSTSGAFNTFFALQNTTSGILNATLGLTDSAGAVVATQVVAIPAGRTVSLNTVTLGAPRDRTGVAHVTHDGPAGGVLATAAISNATTDPAYVQPVKFKPVRESR